ncbi:cyclic nucleotide-binding domain-containing protein [Solimonas sp. K1W22B-7]|uniref:Crp/Fnr family transcriptional regulator n=1 Tax=Solimonas sp. K1W22B-7 TaxID=2303331 RepID=UPI000E33128A|nr:cyclic nucleotide-binding domain-containing protein [Solimonas sp. K1W22B-7]AXQ27917.1 cyclic nucleotide-binding domain-containing protein [Solimonas sp. K1W22B-7]
MSLTEPQRYRAVLAESSAFRGLEPRAMDRVIGAAMILEAAAGSQVLFEGQRSSPGFYVVLEGKVEVYQPREGADVRLNLLGRGDCFGEYSLIDGKPASASLRAVEPAKLYFLPSGLFQKLVANDAQAAATIYRNLLVRLITRLRDFNDPA